VSDRDRMPAKVWLSALLVWIVVTSVNLAKPVHMDDTAYLEVARHIVANPLHSTSGLLNWKDVDEPIHAIINQPHLFPYLLAAWMVMFGSTSMALHSLMAIFSLGAILMFQFLASELSPWKNVWLTWLVFASPAFLPSQNLMVDVPLLFFVLAFFSGLTLAATTSHRGWILAAGSCALAILTKYTALFLLPLLALAAVVLKQYKKLWVTAIPVLALVLWSLLNLWDYGGIHVLQRYSHDSPNGGLLARSVRHTLSLISCLGSIAPFSLIIGRRHFQSSAVMRWTGAICIMAGLSTAVASARWNQVDAISWGTAALIGLFFANGLWTLAGTVSAAVMAGRRGWDWRLATLTAWISGLILFLIVFAPFIAVRHVLLLTPPVILLLAQSFDLTLHSRRARIVALLGTGLALALGVSDWIYADAYRAHASVVRRDLGPASRIWYTGHWGWQWYAREQGMLQYQTGISVLQPGDFLVQPTLIARQELPDREMARLTLLTSTSIPSGPGTLFRTMSLLPWGGYYLSTPTTPPWRLSTAPLERFDLFVVR
jgi:hypothetical protein